LQQNGEVFLEVKYFFNDVTKALEMAISKTMVFFGVTVSLSPEGVLETFVDHTILIIKYILAARQSCGKASQRVRLLCNYR